MNNEIDLKSKAILDPDAPQPKPWHSFSGSRPLLTNKKQNSVFQDFPSNLHLIPQCDKGREETVLMKYGYDMRQPFEKTQEYPWSTLVFLRMVFPSYGKFAFGQGSGTFIGPNIILTAAHNVRNINKEAGTEEDLENLQSIEITPGAHQKSVPFGILHAKYVLIPPQYTVKNLNYSDHDWALIIVDRPVGNESGWLGIASLTDEELKDRKINLVGYPGDKDQLKGRQLWGAGDTIKRIYPERFSYWIDTAGGQSGSGIWIWPHADKEPYIVGVHVFGPDKKKTLKNEWENQATRLTPAKFKQITSWIGQYAYKDPLYRSLENWSDDFWDKDKTTLNQAQQQIIPHLLKEGPFMKHYFKGFIDHSLKSGYLSIFTSINNSISELELSDLQIGDEWIKVLAENKTWSGLRDLFLDRNNIGDKGAKALAQNKIWKITRLSLGENNIGDEGAKAIAVNATWRLYSLSLSGNHIGDEGAKALATNKKWRELKELYLSENQIRDEGAKAIAVNETWKELRTLSLSANHIGDEGAKALATSKKWRELKELYLSENQIGDKGVQALAENKTWSEVYKLVLDKNHIGVDGAKAIAMNKTWSHLEYLILDKNNIGSEGAKALAANETWRELMALHLSENQIGDKGAQALAENKIWSRLDYLILDKNSIGDKGAQTLASMRVGFELSLKDNQIGDKGAWALARSKLFKFIFTLELSGNRIGDETAKAMVNIFPSPSCIVILDKNNIRDEEAKALPADKLSPKSDIQYPEYDVLIKKKHYDASRKKRERLVNNFSQESDNKAILLALFILPKKVQDQWLYTTLQDLDLSDQQITCEGAKIIAANNSWSLKKLDLSCNKIGNEGAKAIANNTVWPLEHLSLRHNRIGTDGAQALAQNEQWRLKSLDLKYNSFPVTHFVFFLSEIFKELRSRFGADVINLEEYLATESF